MRKKLKKMCLYIVSGILALAILTPVFDGGNPGDKTALAESPTQKGGGDKPIPVQVVPLSLRRCVRVIH